VAVEEVERVPLVFRMVAVLAFLAKALVAWVARLLSWQAQGQADTNNFQQGETIALHILFLVGELGLVQVVHSISNRLAAVERSALSGQALLVNSHPLM
jgi:uncharacterized protein with ACT and thioredoxin-like domain